MSIVGKLILIQPYYKYFFGYIDILMQALFQIIEKDCDANRMYCLEVLCVIGEKELNIINSKYKNEQNFYFLDK